MSQTPLMKRSTAVWLIENTSLTFEQIAEFCHLHILEVDKIANTDPSIQILGLDPVALGQLNVSEIKRCEEDTKARLVVRPAMTVESVLGKKVSRYTPLAKRKDRPDGIAWLLKYCATLSESQICRLIGTTRTMIDSIRQKSHWNTQNIRPRNPVQLGLCTQIDLENALMSTRKNMDE